MSPQCWNSLYPPPRGGHALFQRSCRLPVQNLLCFRWVCNQHRRISQTARNDTLWHRPADFFNGIYDFFDRRASSCTQVEKDRASLICQVFQRQRVGLTQIVHVDVVANAGAIGSRIVIPKNLQLRPQAQHSFKSAGNQVIFRDMQLANFSAFVGAGSIEITQ